MTALPALPTIDGEPAEPGRLPAATGGATRRSLRVARLRKEYHTHIGVRRVLDDISFEVGEGEKIAVLGRNGSGKSTLVKLLGGVESPTSGQIDRGLSMSWPLGFVGGVTGRMTGAACARFISRLYNRDEKDVLSFVDDQFIEDPELRVGSPGRLRGNTAWRPNYCATPTGSHAT